MSIVCYIWFGCRIQCAAIVISAQAPVHEASLLERHPPLAGLARSICIELLYQSRSKLLADLGKILSQVF